jgi:hypothetical protein
MRKSLWVVAVAGLVLILAAPAIALDFKFGGQYRIRFYSGDNVGGNSPAGLFEHNDPNRNVRGVQIRVRPRFDVSDDNGNITATLGLEVGDIEWGNGGGAQGVTNGVNQTPGSARVGNGAGGSLGADGVNVETKHAYVDFLLPFGIPARVRAGIQYWFLPKGMIVDDDVVGVRAYGTTKPVSYEIAWFRTSGGPATNATTSQSVCVIAGLVVAIGTTGSPFANAAACTGAGGTVAAAQTSATQVNASTVNNQDNNYDWWQMRLDYAAATWLNAGIYGLYGMNKTTAAAVGNTPADSYFIGLTATGKIGIVSYDLDFIYGAAEGGPAGSFIGTGATDFSDVKGYALDAGVHFPIGPVTLHLVGSYATGDKRDGNDSEAFPYISPSWNGAGGLYELIGSGGTFDALDTVQDMPTNLWMIGFGAEYRPVKALWTRFMYGYAGLQRKNGNCFVAKADSPGCFGPSYAKLASKDSAVLGHEISFRADYTLWTGFAVQGAAGVLVPDVGVTATEFVLQLLYNF